MSLLILPFELLRLIFEWCQEYEQPPISRTCKKFYKLIDKKAFVIRNKLAAHSVDLLRWSVTNGYRVDRYIMDIAIRNGSLDVIKLILSKRNYLSKPESRLMYCRRAVNHGQVEILNALLDGSLGTKCELSHVLIMAAIACQRLDIIRMLRDRNCPCGGEEIYITITCSTLETLRFLRSEKCEWFRNKEASLKLASKHKKQDMVDAIESGELD